MMVKIAVRKEHLTFGNGENSSFAKIGISYLSRNGNIYKKNAMVVTFLSVVTNTLQKQHMEEKVCLGSIFRRAEEHHDSDGMMAWWLEYIWGKVFRIHLE